MMTTTTVTRGVPGYEELGLVLPYNIEPLGKARFPM